MKTVLSVTVVLMLALSLGGQPNSANADTKKFKPGPITAGPITVNPDLAIGNVLAHKCLCTPNKLDQTDALYMEGIVVWLHTIIPSNSRVDTQSFRQSFVRVTYHDLASGVIKTLQRPALAGIDGRPVGHIMTHDVILAKRSVGITVTVFHPTDPNPLNNSATIKQCATYVVE